MTRSMGSQNDSDLLSLTDEAEAHHLYSFNLPPNTSLSLCAVFESGLIS